MKKVIPLLLAVVIYMVLSACGQTKNIEFPFEISDVEDVEAYHYIVPADAEKKLLAEQQDINEIIHTLSGITLKDKEIEEHAGSSITSFRFNLTDGTSYNVIYCSDAVKSGTIRFTDDETTWFTSADIGGLWNNCNGDAVKAGENELPVID